MANKRDTSKQKRARQNRSQRDALKARKQAASAPPEARRTKASAAAVSAPGTKKANGAAKRGGFFSPKGDRPPRPPRPGDLPVDIDTLEGSWFTKRVMVPGGRQVLTGLALTVVLSGMLAFQKFRPRGAPSDAPNTESLWDLLGVAAVPVLLIPILAMGVASQFTLSPRRRGIWIAMSVVMSFEILIGFSMYLFSVGFLMYGVWRAAKVEGPVPGSRSARAAERAAEKAAARAADKANE